MSEYIEVPSSAAELMEEITESYVDLIDLKDNSGDIKKVYVETEDEEQVSISIEDLYKRLSNTAGNDGSSPYIKVITSDGKSAKILKSKIFEIVNTSGPGILPVIFNKGELNTVDLENETVALLYDSDGNLCWKKLPQGIWSGDEYNVYQVTAEVDSNCYTNDIAWGTITSGIGSYQAGTKVTISAKPISKDSTPLNKTYYFNGWYNSRELNDEGTDLKKVNSNSTYSFKMPENNLYLTARFGVTSQDIVPIELQTYVSDFNNIEMDYVCDGVEVKFANITKLVEALKTSIPKNSSLDIRIWGYDFNNFSAIWKASGQSSEYEVVENEVFEEEDGTKITRSYIHFDNISQTRKIEIKLMSKENINASTLNLVNFNFDSDLIKSITIVDVPTEIDESNPNKEGTKTTLYLNNSVTVSNSFLIKLKENNDNFFSQEGIKTEGPRLSYVLNDDVDEENVSFKINDNSIDIITTWKSVNSIKITQSFASSHIGKLFHRIEYTNIYNEKSIIYGDGNYDITVEETNPNSNEIIISDAAYNKEMSFYLSTNYNLSSFKYYPRWYLCESIGGSVIQKNEITEIYKSNENNNYYLLESDGDNIIIIHTYTPKSQEDITLSVENDPIDLYLNYTINYVHESKDYDIFNKLNNDNISLNAFIKDQESEDENFISYNKDYNYKRGDYVKLDFSATNYNGIGFTINDSSIKVNYTNGFSTNVKNESKNSNELLYHIDNPDNTAGNVYYSNITESINFSVIFDELRYYFCNGASKDYINTYLNLKNSIESSSNIKNGVLFLEKYNDNNIAVSLEENNGENKFNYINVVSGYDNDILLKESLTDSFDGVLSESREYDVTFSYNENLTSSYNFYGWLVSKSTYSSLTDTETITSKLIYKSSKYTINNYKDKDNIVTIDDLKIYKYTVTGIFIIGLLSSISDEEVKTTLGLGTNTIINGN